MEQWEDYEYLRIETPEGLDLYLPLAGFGPRFLAFFLDMIAVSVLQGVLLAVALFGLIFSAAGFGSGMAPGDDSFVFFFIAIMVLTLIVALLVPVLYFVLFELAWSGQTPGKRAAGIRVIRRGGYPAGRREIFFRNVWRIVDYLPSNWLVGVVSFFATKNQQRIGDLAADTVVVREFAGRGPVLGSPQPAGPWDTAPLPAEPGRVTPQLAYIIGSYLARAAQLDVELRDRLSLRCIEALGYQGSHLSLQQREQYLVSIANAGWSRV